MTFRRIALIKPGGKKGLGFMADGIPIGLEYIASSIEKEVETVHIIDMELEKQSFPDILDEIKPDLIGLTMSATEHNEGLRLAEIAKEREITTVLGGYHPTAIPEELLSHPQIDMIVRGEGELTMKELIQKGSSEGVLGVSYKKGGQIIHNPDRPFIEDLDALPFPARHLRRHKYRNYMNNDRDVDVITMSRGCWGRCSFCCEPYMNKSQMRFRSPENVIDELAEIIDYHNGKPLNILATDPHFIGDPKIVDRFCDLLEQQKFDVKFSVMTRVDSVARNPELVKKMCDNGIFSYELGFESPNPRDLKAVKKGTTIEAQREAVKILRENGANVSGTFVIGLPGHTEEEIKQFPVYAKEIGLVNAAFGIATPFPGTEFYENLDKDGLIFENDWTKYDEMHSVFKLNPLTSARLEELESYCMARFWTLKTLLDGTKVRQKRTNSKLSLKQFLDDVFVKLSFIKSAGFDLREQTTYDHLKVVMDAIIDAEKEEKNRNIQAHDILEMSTFLKILGSQTLQITMSYDDTIISYYIITSSKSVDRVEAISGIRDNASININVDLEGSIDSFKPDAQFNPMNLFFIFKQARGFNDIWNLMRLSAAITIDLGGSYLKEKIMAIT